MPVVNPEYLFRILLIFVRIGGLMVAAPVFSSPSVPVRLRVLFSVILAYLLAGLVPTTLPDDVGHPAGFLTAIAIEALTGVALGFAAQFIFWIVHFAGEIAGFQMGLAIAQILNPLEGHTSNPLGRLLSTLLLLVFLLLDGHHQILRALVASFDLVPLAGARLAASGPFVLEWTTTFLVTGLRLAAPFMVTIFLVDTALGVFARVAPQTELFTLSLPLKLIAGLGLLYFFMQHFLPFISVLRDSMVRDLAELLTRLVPV